jgi:DNA-binding NtrC family response regulator
MLTILIVEDDAAVRALLADVLHPTYEVVAVGSAEEAVESLRLNSFAAALVDVNLPGMHGADLVGAMNTRHPEIAVIVISGEPMDRSHHWWAMGAFAFLVKPLDLDEVERYVEMAIEWRRAPLKR